MTALAYCYAIASCADMYLTHFGISELGLHEANRFMQLLPLTSLVLVKALGTCFAACGFVWIGHRLVNKGKWERAFVYSFVVGLITLQGLVVLWNTSLVIQ